MKKKGIVLLITLFFITAISMVILQNLEDSESFIKEVSLDDTLTQNKITTQNVQKEIIKLINKYKGDDEAINGILEVAVLGIPFNYGNIDLVIYLEEYFTNGCNLNTINLKSPLNGQCEEYITNNILYEYDFLEKLKKYKPFNTKEQIRYFINQYIQDTRDDKISLVIDDFGYLKKDENETARYIKCNYDISIQDRNSTVEFIFKIGEKEPIYFEYLLSK